MVVITRSAECPICFDRLNKLRHATFAPCGHMFHLRWLDENFATGVTPSCCICRAEMSGMRDHNDVKMMPLPLFNEDDDLSVEQLEQQYLAEDEEGRDKFHKVLHGLLNYLKHLEKRLHTEMKGIRYGSELEYKEDVDREFAIAIRRKRVMCRVDDRRLDVRPRNVRQSVDVSVFEPVITRSRRRAQEPSTRPTTRAATRRREEGQDADTTSQRRNS
ncbi:hypothetical protein PRIPAC_92037 [Pristionchus pacificus]|uniref:RING-type domain-containing protein n=1 Tax=Pristionchus pacificus TaxID=54126 RepID=A0A2A6BAR5_PRIPA|nr:hypothetical protein PRIPAC_92037 [Pristionchus pacificus]|eukprot:PDM62931.1 hypothetical protein PRIPAC_50146 [Pristionchus pacificus]